MPSLCFSFFLTSLPCYISVIAVLFRPRHRYTEEIGKMKKEKKLPVILENLDRAGKSQDDHPH